MNQFVFESVLQNGSFITLLLATLLSWWKITFGKTSNKKYLNWFLNYKFLLSNRFFILSSNLLLGTSLIGRWFISNHAPFSNLYESLLWLCWGIITFSLFNSKIIAHSSIVAPLSSSALLIHGFANFCLPGNIQSPNSLVPALQSNWLLMHVSIMMFSYSCLFCGGIISLIFLAFSKKKILSFCPLKLTNPLFLQQTESYLFLERLDQISSRSIATGFCLLTIGILSGAVWANEAWGSYWSWDPKETWALITWFVFATYLHLRIFRNWKGFQSATLASFGLLILWICYFGLNWLGQGLHTYGFFN
nr:cytochrome c biogenesis protein [Klebsormidium sp. TAA2-JRJ3pt]